MLIRKSRYHFFNKNLLNRLFAMRAFSRSHGDRLPRSEQ